MDTSYVPEKQLERALRRNEAWWRGELEDYPLLWVYASDAKPGPPMPRAADEAELWTNVDLAMAAAVSRIARTHFAGDALPTYNPWLGPDQFAAWLGADLTVRPQDNTTWVVPFVKAWVPAKEWRIDPANKWWRLYCDLLEESVRVGRDKWATAFPDLHTGIDALSALRGPDNLLVDLLEEPEAVLAVMEQMTGLWKRVVDYVWAILRSSGQGTTNWTGGWSEKRFVCVGQNDFTCMISPEMFDRFCLEDTVECVNHIDHALYHLDGPGALRHLPRLLEIDRLHTVQWIHGDGQPPHSHWLDMLEGVQRAGKAVQIWYNLGYVRKLDMFQELETVCTRLDPARLFIAIEAASAEQADALVKFVVRLCSRRP